MTQAAAALARKSSYSYDDIIACAKGKLFGPGVAKLPLPPMLMVDRIPLVSAEGGAHAKGELVAEFDIKPDLWFFACHFEGDPVMPGCLGLDALWQLLGFWMIWSGGKGAGRALGVGEVKFTGQVLPTARKVTYRINIKRFINRRLILAIGDGEVLVDGKLIYTATDLKVALFENTAAMGAE